MLNTTAFVLAGGISQGFSVLTDNRAKSAMPVFGHYRLIDFALSSLSLSDIANVGVIIQYLPGSLIDHIGVGQAYDFDAPGKTFKLMPPFMGVGKTEWFRGTADALYQNMNFLHDTKADLVLVVSGDHVYSMDYRPLILHHTERGADLTIVTCKRPADAPPQLFGYPTVEKSGRVVSFAEKPAQPSHDTISMGIYLFNARTLCQWLESTRNSESHNLPIDIVTPLCREGGVYAYPFQEEWHYLHNLEAYIALHQRLIDCKCMLHNTLWHAMTNLRDRELGSRPSPYFGAGSQARESIISPGCIIEGTVIRSVLSPGVYVAKNAVVSDSILFHDCRVLECARLHGVVSDKDAVFHPHCQLGFDSGEAISPRLTQRVIVGKEAVVQQGVKVEAGSVIGIGRDVGADLQALAMQASASR